MKKAISFLLSAAMLVSVFIFMPAVTAAADADGGTEAAQTDFYMRQGASVRTGEVSGVRFVSEITAQRLAEINETAGVKSVEHGTIIVPAAYVEKAGDLTIAALEAAELEYLDIPSLGWYETSDTVYSFAGSVVDIKEENYALRYSGRGYFKMTYDSGETEYIYAGFNRADDSRSPYALAMAAHCAGDTSADIYLNGVATVSSETGKYSVKYKVNTAADVLAGVSSAASGYYSVPYSARSDGNLNIWIYPESGAENPTLIYVDGLPAAIKSDDGYTNLRPDAVSAISAESDGVLVSMKYTSALDGLSAGATKSGTISGTSILSNASVSLETVYRRQAVTENGSKYYILQSCCTDGKYIYYILNKAGNLVNMLVKADLDTGKVVKETYANGFDHGNGITYNLRTNELIIVHNDNGDSSDTDNKKWISIVDAGTLEVKEKKKLQYKLYSCEYVANGDTYAFGIASTYYHRFCNSSFVFSGTTSYNATNVLTKQDMTIDCEHVIYPQYKTLSSTGMRYNYISVFSYPRSYIGLIEYPTVRDGSTSFNYEIEDSFVIGGTLYSVFYVPSNGISIMKTTLTIN